MASYRISPINEDKIKAVQDNWDRTAKPLDALGELEAITAKIGGILGKDDFTLKKRAIIAFCADNGIVAQGISQSGQDITLVVARAMGEGVSSVAKLAKLSNTDFFAVDIGINTTEKIKGVKDKKVALGTRDFSIEPAMTEDECNRCIEIGIEYAGRFKAEGYELVGIGEMGIGNTTTTAAVASALLKKSASELTGKGAGLSDKSLLHKINIIQEAIEKYELYDADPIRVLSCVGGFDIAGMTGVIIGGAMVGLPVVLDGAISAVCALLAEKILPGAGKRTIASHLSKEPSAKLILGELELSPIIRANLALGEGTGAAMFYSLLDHAMALYSAPTTFDDMNIDAYTRFV